MAVIKKMPTLKSKIVAPLFYGMNENAPTEPISTNMGAMV